ncbi:MAG TPA: FHA domain-containing protein [Candidatus Thermoplasmatota archaeon]|nr:FHA domain-containing protein [Candidatus Thermoplasmatota archaeon]
MDLEASAAQDDALARSLVALAHPSRLALLRQLRAPKTLREISLRPGASAGGGSSAGDEGRSISRQAVREHLDRLMGIGVVHASEAERDYGETTEYSLNHQALYALSEEFRGLARLRPASEPVLATVARPGLAAESAPEGPCLVLVKGLDEGRSFPLVAAHKQQWTIGRRRGLDVSLDFDPFVSTENTVVSHARGAFSIEDLPDSRNGTLVNFLPLAKGERRALRSADVIGVGRSLLVFRG